MSGKLVSLSLKTLEATSKIFQPYVRIDLLPEAVFLVVSDPSMNEL